MVGKSAILDIAGARRQAEGYVDKRHDQAQTLHPIIRR